MKIDFRITFGGCDFILLPVIHHSNIVFTLAECGTVRYGTIQYGTVRVYIPKNMRRLRGLAARSNHVRFNVAMPIDSVRVRSIGAVYAYIAHFMLCSPNMEL